MEPTLTIQKLVDDEKNNVSRYSIYRNDSKQLLRALYNFNSYATDNILACFVLVVSNPSRPSLHLLSCKLKVLSMVLCEKPIKGSKKDENDKVIPFNFKNVFECAKGTYISILSLCDGKEDCPDQPNDEVNCTCMVNGKKKYDSYFCLNICHPSNCTCPSLLIQKIMGGCELFQKEKEVGPTAKYKDYLRNIISKFLIRNSSLLYTDKYKCSTKNMLECFPGLEECYHESNKCQYLLKEVSGILEICSNGKHLEDCEAFHCHGRYKCPNSYCISYSYVCNGKWDCWNGDDEHDCTNRVCRGLFICRHTTICIPLHLVCNQKIDCPFEEDESFCYVWLYMFWFGNIVCACYNILPA